MLVKLYFSEIILTLAVVFMTIYPAHIGAIVFALALTALGAFKALDTIHTRDDHAMQAQIDKIKSDLDIIKLSRRSGH